MCWFSDKAGTAIPVGRGRKKLSSQVMPPLFTAHTPSCRCPHPGEPNSKQDKGVKNWGTHTKFPPQCFCQNNADPQHRPGLPLLSPLG